MHRLPPRNVPSHVKRAPDKWLCYALDEPMTIGGGDSDISTPAMMKVCLDSASCFGMGAHSNVDK